MASRPAKHDHQWYPLIHAAGDYMPKFAPGVLPKPKGYTGWKAGDVVLWFCKVGRCVSCLTHVEMYRLKAKGKFVEVEPPE